MREFQPIPLSGYRHELQLYRSNPTRQAFPWLRMAFAFALGVIAMGALIVVTP